MKYKCSCENISTICFSNFKSGRRCKKCSGKEKHTLEDIQQYFKDQGCELLETEYINCITPMKYICNCGDTSKITFDSFRRGRRCKKCGIEKIKEKRKLKFEDVKQYFKDNNCALLETKYINTKTKMKYECSCGNISTICFSNFKSGRRCKKCGIQKNAQSKKFSYKEVQQYFEDQGCELLETKYINVLTKMKYKCNCGNISTIRFSFFKNGQRCKKCAIKNSTGNLSVCWNPKLSQKDREDKRDYIQYTQWRTDIYKKNNYTCQNCSSRKDDNGKYKKIHAHHIDGYAENPDLRIDINNGITLCQECHNKFHSIYGKININRYQLDEFLNNILLCQK